MHAVHPELMQLCAILPVLHLLCTAWAQVIVVDEIGSREEVTSARKISQQGVSLVATTHAVSLRSLIRNPELNSLVGGLATVTLGDEAAQ